MNRHLHYLLCSLLILISFSSQAQYTLKISDITYSVANDELTINSYTSKDEPNIIIPETFEVDGSNIPVTAIKSGSYSNVGVFYRKGISVLSLPSTMKIIGDYAFSNNIIESLNILKNITSIGKYAFSNNKLENVVFEDESNISVINEYALANNTNLTSLRLPLHEQTSFEAYIDMDGNEYAVGDEISDFDKMYLSKVFYTLNNEDVTVEDGRLIECTYDFTYKCIKIPDVLDGQTVTSITTGFQYKQIILLELPNQLKSIGSYSFRSNSLIHIDIPETVTSIGSGAFTGNKLTEVTIPVAVRNIGSRAFNGNRLTEIVIPEGITSLQSGVFSNNNLTTISLPNSITTIGGDAFSYNNITELEINEGVTFIDYYAFKANEITKLTIPESVTKIGIASFNQNKITEVNGMPSMGLIYARNTDGTVDYTKTVSYGGVETIMNFIPASVKNIGQETFRGAVLTSITIPATVEIISSWAFWSSRSATSIIIEENSKLHTIGQGAFQSTSIGGVTIPSSVTYVGKKAFYSSGSSSFDLPTPDSPMGYAFTLWNEDIAGGSNVTDLEIAYEAKFTPNVYNISFAANGGEGVMLNQPIDFDATVALEMNEYTRTNYVFNSWNTLADGSGDSFIDGADFTMYTEGITLYAQWDLPTDMLELEHMDIQVYPNPASDVICINGNNLSNTLLTLYNSAGTIVLQYKDYTTKTPISISHLPKGVYLLNIKGNTINYTNKFMIKR